MYFYKKPSLSRVDRALLPPVGLVMLSVVIYFVIKIALLLPPQSPLAVTVLCHLVRCSHVSSNQCISTHASTTFVCLETSSAVSLQNRVENLSAAGNVS